MARFDAYANPDATERSRIPYLLDVQNDYLGPLQTRVVVPLWSPGVLQHPIQRLNPALTVAGDPVLMDTAALAAFPSMYLRQPVDHLGAQRLAIQDALDTLFGPY